VNFVAFGQKQFGQIRTILSGDAGDERLFYHSFQAEVFRNGSGNARLYEGATD
jgi:hypothetical protein